MILLIIKLVHMFKIFLATALVGAGLTGPQLLAFETPSPIAPAAPSFVINNRPLIRINGKIISLMDVVKKMDLLIYEHFPETRSSPVRLYQFYMSQWKYTFEDMVFHELTLADGVTKEIKISDGDVRETMEQRFGPNIISNLSKLNLQYDEVKTMIHDELLVRQLQGMKIYSKAQLSVTPEVVKKEYMSYLAKNPPKEEWVYQVISVRGKDQTVCESIIKKVFSELKLSSTKLASLQDDLKSLPQIQDESVSFNMSKEFVVENKNLSEEHRRILTALNTNEFSAPIAQTSRVDNSIVYRIFHLKDHIVKNPPLFNAIAGELENNLLNDAVQKEREVYKALLYKKFGIDAEFLKQILPDDYQPFVLK